MKGKGHWTSKVIRGATKLNRIDEVEIQSLPHIQQSRLQVWYWYPPVSVSSLKKLVNPRRWTWTDTVPTVIICMGRGSFDLCTWMGRGKTLLLTTTRTMAGMFSSCFVLICLILLACCTRSPTWLQGISINENGATNSSSDRNSGQGIATVRILRFLSMRRPFPWHGCCWIGGNGDFLIQNINSMCQTAYTSRRPGTVK